MRSPLVSIGGTRGNLEKFPLKISSQSYDITDGVVSGVMGDLKGTSEESACNSGDLGSIPGSGRSPGEGNGYPFQYPCLENSMGREPGRIQSMGSQKSQT